VARTYWELAPVTSVATCSGPLRGLVIDGMHRFLGIPYAAPPVGSLRWHPPQPPAGWRLPRDAFAYGSVCAQNNKAFPGFGHSSHTEDCLYLNVYAPEGADADSRLPVMVWIPGGGLFIGGSNGYDPSALVKQGHVVFVSFNYRINVFGFFSHPAINAEDHEIGNYGLMDQQAALRWVRDNIAGFGGDPNNVTIFGESAGGTSVWCQLASPLSRGLFHKAIIQSGAAAPLLRTPSTRDLEEIGVELLAHAGASSHTSDELRAMPTSDLMAANLLPEGTFGTGRFEIGHTVDGTVIPEPMVDLFTSGRFNGVPVINGTNRSEFNWFQGMIELTTGRPIPAEAYASILADALAGMSSTLLGRSISPDRIGDVVQAYPVADFPSASEALAAAIGDCGFISLGNRKANEVLRRHIGDVYCYEFDAPDSGVPWPAVSFRYGSAHTKDLQYLFPGFRGGGGYPVPQEPADAKLTHEMVSYWTTFALRGTPNAESPWLPVWHNYDPSRDNSMVLSIPECYEIERFGDRHNCDLWESVSTNSIPA
jgi:para-nitrobenzyl esterase